MPRRQSSLAETAADASARRPYQKRFCVTVMTAQPIARHVVAGGDARAPVSPSSLFTSNACSSHSSVANRLLFLSTPYLHLSHPNLHNECLIFSGGYLSWLESLVYTQNVGGSSPSPPTSFLQ